MELEPLCFLTCGILNVGYVYFLALRPIKENAMRFKLVLHIDKKYGNRLPFNYQYEQMAVIYKILSLSSESYANWLHDNGFELDGKQFKLFTYSSLIIPSRWLDKEHGCLHINSDTVEWYISFLPEKSTRQFIQGIFMEQTFQLGNRQNVVQFKVQSVEMLPALDCEEEAEFRTLSPMCISRREENGKTVYLSPVDPYAKGAILMSLLNRYVAYYGKPYQGILNYDFTVTNVLKSKLITIKADTPQQTRVKGFLCEFRMKAPKELMNIMYESGIAEKGSSGFGMVEKIDKSSLK